MTVFVDFYLIANLLIFISIYKDVIASMKTSIRNTMYWIVVLYVCRLMFSCLLNVSCVLSISCISAL